MSIMTQTLAKVVYSLDLEDLPLDRLQKSDHKKRSGVVSGGGGGGGVRARASSSATRKNLSSFSDINIGLKAHNSKQPHHQRQDAEGREKMAADLLQPSRTPYLRPPFRKAETDIAEDSTDPLLAKKRMSTPAVSGVTRPTLLKQSVFSQDSLSSSASSTLSQSTGLPGVTRIITETVEEGEGEEEEEEEEEGEGGKEGPLKRPNRGRGEATTDSRGEVAKSPC